MNECKKCGQEFEGNFCPNCGKEWVELNSQTSLPDKDYFFDDDNNSLINPFNGGRNKARGYDELVKPVKPRNNEAYPSYFEKVKQQQEKYKILRIILLIIGIIPNFICGIIGARLGGGYVALDGMVKSFGGILPFLITITSIFLFPFISIIPYSICFGETERFRNDVFRGKGYLVGVPIIVTIFCVLSVSFPLFMSPTSPIFNMDNIVYGEGFLKENVIIIIVSALVSFASLFIHQTIAINLSKGMRKIVFGDADVKKKDKTKAELTILDKK